MKKSVHKLIVEPESDIALWAIVSSESDYRLSWLLNTRLSFQLSKTENFKTFHSKTGIPQEFSTYCFEDEEKCLACRLYSNQCENGFLIEELKNIDYLFQILGNISNTELNSLLTKIREIENISALIRIDPVKYKSAKKLFL
ncbi:MAG: IPExxxVDY family protein [Bacteroidota bacterium]|nr:IPExxxVDY family protein [Bacteroidota bacterium]